MEDDFFCMDLADEVFRVIPNRQRVERADV